ncbi:ATP synthase subunit I [Ureibacillus terrenus]|uniref:ATP synthase subunit I n=1 Tax=Ureibacillus terrenus TaxID=118246 RepID=A0A540V2F0_9BACL|nr:ATP synthase subunit I [Ureibacillus terrenus]MED3661381.1 ATP synthase subunit I [Ureibacillus terrenus]MED3764147.1 ATP synthase subunit I [Ureibacillus terrenus]TQE90898.1 ATP synthase subunit I [Ureibacillus terrenus]
MLDLHRIFEKQKKGLFFLLALCVSGWFFTSYPTIFAGIGIGAVFGTYNFWILVRRMDKFDRSYQEGKRISLGSGLRFASAIAAVAIPIAFPEYFNVVSSVIGLMIPYVFLFIEALYSLFKTEK